MSEPSPRFVVARIRYTDQCLWGRPECPRRLPAKFPVASFASDDEARAECLRLERKARKGVNPFTMGGPALFYQTSLDAGRLNDWLLDRGVKPQARHAAGHAAWRGWWKA